VFLSKGLYPHEFFRPTVESILATQQDDGTLPWFDGGHADPWDHVEAAMGLTIGGEYAAARRAYRWLADQQLTDGSWWAGYKGGAVHNGERRESNFVAYVATGLWHYYLVTGDRPFLQALWPCVERAIEFVLALQTRHGDIHWAVDARGQPLQDALVTGSSSIYKSLECAVNIASALGMPRPEWRHARQQLGDALRNKPHRFDRTWESKARFSMDWFYPVLAGVLPRAQAQARLRARWDEFVEPEMGCRCVADEPWVTVAESCELTLALLAVGDRARAATLYSWLHQWRDPRGAYWTGYQFVEDVLWPLEQPTWTAGAILLAADALTEFTPAHRLFTRVELADTDAPGQSASALQSPVFPST
jgi:hypothetical protein